MICMSCTPPIADAGPRPSTPAGRIAAAVRRAWRNYWHCRATKATVLMLRALGERTLRDIGIDPGEVKVLVKGECLIGDGRDSRRCR
jgi:uncharacterized protein YjiS (DUF1127 family)